MQDANPRKRLTIHRDYTVLSFHSHASDTIIEPLLRLLLMCQVLPTLMFAGARTRPTYV